MTRWDSDILNGRASNLVGCSGAPNRQKVNWNGDSRHYLGHGHELQTPFFPIIKRYEIQRSSIKVERQTWYLPNIIPVSFDVACNF